MPNQYVQTQVVCANCAAIRGENNHWFLITPSPILRNAMWITIYDDTDPPIGGELPACGSNCALILVAKNLEKL